MEWRVFNPDAAKDNVEGDSWWRSYKSENNRASN